MELPARACEICGERTALYLCQNCGAAICAVCDRGWVCKKCGVTTQLGSGLLLPIAITIISLGFALVILGSFTPGNSGGCFIWPLPFVIGCGVGTGPAGIIAALAFVTVFSLFLFLFRVLPGLGQRGHDYSKIDCDQPNADSDRGKSQHSSHEFEDILHEPEERVNRQRCD